MFASRRNVVFRSFVLGGLGWMTIPIVTGSIGLLALASKLEVPQVNMVFPVMTAQLLGAGGAALVFIVVFASLTSTLDSLLASTADLLAEDVFLKLFKPTASDRELKLATQWMVVLLGGMTLLLCWQEQDSLMQVLFFTGALVASTVWPVACGLYWTSASRGGAIVAMLAGTTVGQLAFWQIGPFTHFGPSCSAVLSAAVSAVVMIVASRFWPAEFRWSQLQEET